VSLHAPEPWRRGVPERLLAQFGVSEDELCDQVLTSAQNAARSYEGDLYPRMGPGQVRHLHLVRNLSRLLIPRGYERHDDDNVSRLVHRDRGIAIAVTSGNSATGLPYSIVRRHPSTKYPKGAAVQAVVQRNGQLSFLGMGDDQDEPINLAAYVTWFLMVYVDKRSIRAEVSCPAGVSAKGYVSTWNDRLLVRTLPNDGFAVDLDFGPEDDGGGVDVPVEPR
jgi:hypothetical protein